MSSRTSSASATTCTYRGHFVREPTDGADTLCDEGGCGGTQPELPVEVIDRDTDDASRPGTREDVPRVYHRRRPGDGASSAAAAAEAASGRGRGGRAEARQGRRRGRRARGAARDAPPLSKRRRRSTKSAASKGGPSGHRGRYRIWRREIDFVEEDNDPHAPADLQKHFEETAVLWDRIRARQAADPAGRGADGKELYHQGYDPWDFKCYDLSCLEGEEFNIHAAAGRGGKGGRQARVRQ